jgi:indolepyruvate decarboxylase
MQSQQSIGGYLIQRLYEHGVRHVFGVPGDFVLGFDKLLEASELQFITTCDEQGAGFAADAYARMRGLGVVCVTYCVGGLKIANTTAQAFAEKSPVVVISGAPGTNERIKNPLLHHKVKEFDTQYQVFQQLTIDSVVLDDSETAFQDIDRVLRSALRYKRPVYIELPRDQVNMTGNTDFQPVVTVDESNTAALSEAINETVKLLNAARQPVILAGIELNRFGLQNDLLRLVEKTNMPVAETILGKSVVPEMHPNYIGIYGGAMGYEKTRNYVESSDCLLLLGTFLSDMNLGIFTANLDPKHSIYVTSEKTSIHFHHYEGIRLQDFIQTLIQTDLQRHDFIPFMPVKDSRSFSPIVGQPITVERLFQKLNVWLSDDMVVVADVGDALFAGLDLFIHDKSRFFSPAYYASLGFAVPASIGLQLANPTARPLVLVGDGAFQMTGMELSTIVRYGLNPIVIVLNNGGYGTERPMQDGLFNDILRWQYSRIPDVLGSGLGFSVTTEDELETALQESQAHAECFSILDVYLDARDISPALKRLTSALKKFRFS